MKDNMKEKWITYKGHNVGFVLSFDNLRNVEEKVYVTERKKMFEYPLGSGNFGFSISKEIFIKYLKKLNVVTIRVKLMENELVKAVYITTLEKWLREGKENWFGLKDLQLFMPVENFDIRGE